MRSKKNGDELAVKVIQRPIFAGLAKLIQREIEIQAQVRASAPLARSSLPGKTHLTE